MAFIKQSKIHYLFFLLSFLINGNKGFSQFNTDFFVDTTQQLSISFQANYNYGSTVMDNEFMSKFLFGGKIEREQKDRTYQNLSSNPFNNRLGLDFNYQLNVEVPFDTILGKTNISMLFGLGSRDHLDAAFAENLYRLAFDGNKQFAGETIDIGNTNYNQYRFQQLSIGFIHYKKSDNKTAKEGVIVNLIKGQEHQAITIPRGALYTEELGREIEVNLNYVYNATDTANTGFLAFNGIGIGTDLFTEFFLKNGDKIYLGVQDLGFVYWNNKSIELSTDSSYQFSGITVNSIFDLNDSIIDNLSKDSIINTVATTNIKDDYSIALPTAIHLTYTKVFSQKWKVNVGVYHKILSNHFPLLYTNAYYYFNPKFSIKAQLGYGGYGKFNSGLAIGKSFKNFLNVFVGTNNIEGLLVPNKAYANSGFIGIKKYF